MPVLGRSAIESSNDNLRASRSGVIGDESGCCFLPALRPLKLVCFDFAVAGENISAENETKAYGFRV